MLEPGALLPVDMLLLDKIYLFIFLYGQYVINIPEYLTLHKRSGCLQQPLGFPREDGSQGFPAACRAVPMAALVLLLYFLCEGHTISRWHVVSIFLMTLFGGIFHLISLICSAFLVFVGSFI